MKFSFTAVAVVMMALFFSFPVWAEEGVLARVNGKAITQQDVNTFYETSPAKKQGLAREALTPIIVDQLISMHLVDEQIEKSNLTEDKAVQQKLERLRREGLRTLWLDKEVEKRLTDKALKAKYNEKVEATKEEKEINARHILVETEEAAKEIIKQLDNGTDFETLAKEKSIGPSGEKGGDLGYFTKGAMVLPFSEAAFALKKGQYTKEPVQTQFGWHVILLEDKRDIQPPSFKEVKPRLRAELSRAFLGDIVKELQEKATIERFDNKE